jgi:hypothetical protein
MLERQEGWEARLAGVIDWARSRPYVLGEHDCFRFACADVEALTGRDLWSTWGGTYRTRMEALRRLTEVAPEGTPVAQAFDAAFSRIFGSTPVPVRQARRGDIVKYVDAGEPHLGVCVDGKSVAVLGEHGLKFALLRDCVHAWRIG